MYNVTSFQHWYEDEQWSIVAMEYPREDSSAIAAYVIVAMGVGRRGRAPQSKCHQQWKCEKRALFLQFLLASSRTTVYAYNGN